MLTIDHTDRISRLVVGIRELKKKHYDQAREDFAQSVRGPVTDLTATLLSAWAQPGDGDTHAAIDTMDKLSGPDWYGIFKDLHAGLILDDAKDAKGAGKRYASAYKADPTALRTVEAYGRWLSRNASKDDALKVYRDFAQQLPNHPVIDDEMKQISDGVKLPPLVDTPQAAPPRRCMGLAPRSDAAAARIPRYLSAACALPRAEPCHGAAVARRSLRGSQKPDLAIKAYERVPASSPLSRNAQIQTAVDLDALNRTDESKKLLEKVIADHPKDTEAIIELGNVERGHKDFADCAKTYSKAIDSLQNPEKSNWVTFYFRGICYQRSHQWPLAEADMKKALQLYPDQPLVLNYLGYSWVDQGVHLDEGMDMIRKAVEQRPDDGYIVDSLGWAYFRTGNYDEAVKIWNAPSSSSPRSDYQRSSRRCLLAGGRTWKRTSNGRRRSTSSPTRKICPSSRPN